MLCEKYIKKSLQLYRILIIDYIPVYWYTAIVERKDKKLTNKPNKSRLVIIINNPVRYKLTIMNTHFKEETL